MRMSQRKLLFTSLRTYSGILCVPPPPNPATLLAPLAGQLSVPFFMLAIMSIVFSVMYITIEGGSECFMGQECIHPWPEEILENEDNIPEGTRFLITEYGESQVPDAMVSVFYVIVTLTSVGFGDVVPKTMMGKSLAAIMMMLGTLYLSMPLTIVGGQFISR